MTDHPRDSADPAWPDTRARILDAARGATVIWDFDGVIADTEPLHADAYRLMLSERGHTPHPAFFDALIGHSEPECWAKLRESGSPIGTDVAQLTAERRELFLTHAPARLRPSWLCDAIIGPVGEVAARQLIVSAGDPDTITALLGTWAMGERLEYRPHTGGLRKADTLAALWAGGPTVTIEDNERYLAAAAGAGSFTVAVHHSMSPARMPDADVHLAI